MNTLCKAERLHSKIVIEKMFAGGFSRSFSVFPLRVVYMSGAAGSTCVYPYQCPQKAV